MRTETQVWILAGCLWINFFMILIGLNRDPTTAAFGATAVTLYVSILAGRYLEYGEVPDFMHFLKDLAKLVEEPKNVAVR